MRPKIWDKDLFFKSTLSNMQSAKWYECNQNRKYFFFHFWASFLLTLHLLCFISVNKLSLYQSLAIVAAFLCVLWALVLFSPFIHFLLQCRSSTFKGYFHTLKEQNLSFKRCNILYVEERFNSPFPIMFLPPFIARMWRIMKWSELCIILCKVIGKGLERKNRSYTWKKSERKGLLIYESINIEYFITQSFKPVLRC